MSGVDLAGGRLVRRPLWPTVLESLMISELLHLWDTGRGELLIDSAWVSNLRFHSIAPARFKSMGLPDTSALTLSGYLQSYLALGGAVRLMFRDDPRDPASSQPSRALVQSLLSGGAFFNDREDAGHRISGEPLEVRTHPRGHRKRLLGMREGYVGSANLTANGLFNDADDTFIYRGADQLRPFIDSYLAEWDKATQLVVARVE